MPVRPSSVHSPTVSAPSPAPHDSPVRKSKTDDHPFHSMARRATVMVLAAALAVLLLASSSSTTAPVASAARDDPSAAAAAAVTSSRDLQVRDVT